jgi:hypothetical protein
MSGCYEPQFEKCQDKSCIACHGGVWGIIHPPICNDKIRNSMIKPGIATYEDFIMSRLTSLETHKIAQIDENRKISRRVDELEEVIRLLKEDIEDLQMFRHAKLNTPHKCPVCDGKGGFYISGTMDEECNACKGKGIVWG